MMWWGFIFSLVSLYTGVSIMVDPDCDTVSLTGGGYRRAFLTCYQAGVETGFMSANLAGVIIILLGLAMGFVSFMSIFR